MTRILLVDDNPFICRAVSRNLKRINGYEVDTAPDGQTALEKLAKRPYGVIVSDQDMPGMRGTELLKIVKGVYPTTTRILATGRPEAVADREQNYHLVSKPYTASDLRRIIEGHTPQS